MSFTCFWRFLFIATIISIVQSTELYCVTHRGSIQSHHNLKTCTASKSRPISAAALTTSERGNNNTTTQNRISFDLICKSDPATCAGVSATFAKATDIISSVFQFESPLLINASFVNFCQEYKDCSSDNNKMTSIGQAFPAISYIMVDKNDNMTRMYPQPLLKQYTELDVKPTWTKYDINAQFNNQVNWYFVNNPNPISQDQTDFLKNVLHELIHGLGFVSSWFDNLYKAIVPLFPNQTALDRFLTPALLASTDNDQLLDSYNTKLPFWGFVEFPLDKFIFYKTERYNGFTTVTKRLNQFCNSNVIFRNLIDLANSWYSSDAYGQATRLYGRSVTPLNVLAVVNDEPILWLETSVAPFSTGSSLCHVDQSQYINSTEYLMVYTANRGVALSYLDQVFPAGPIGPKLQKIMAALGYRVHAGFTIQRPTLGYWSPPPGLVGTDSNPTPSLTIDTNGPARSPTSSSSSSVSTTLSASATTKSSNVGIRRRRSSNWLLLPSCIIIIIISTLLI